MHRQLQQLSAHSQPCFSCALPNPLNLPPPLDSFKINPRPSILSLVNTSVAIKDF